MKNKSRKSFTEALKIPKSELLSFFSTFDYVCKHVNSLLYESKKTKYKYYSEELRFGPNRYFYVFYYYKLDYRIDSLFWDLHSIYSAALATLARRQLQTIVFVLQPLRERMRSSLSLFRSVICFEHLHYDCYEIIISPSLIIVFDGGKKCDKVLLKNLDVLVDRSALQIACFVIICTYSCKTVNKVIYF